MTISNLIAAYLFFGGSGAGTFAMAALLKALDAREARRNLRCATTAARKAARHPFTTAALHQDALANRGFVAAFALLALGVLCLVLDLGRPDMALLLFLYPTFSYLTAGAYALALLLPCALFLALAPQLRPTQAHRVAGMVALVLGGVASLFVMTYTGLLLHALDAIPFWDSAFLPVLFVASSLAAGGGCITLCANLIDAQPRTRARFARRFAAFDVALIVVEVVATACYLASVSGTALGAQSVHQLLQGGASALFVGGFATCGLAVPATLDVASLRGCSKEWLATTAAAATIVGCFCLRLALVQAGIHATV